MMPQAPGTILGGLPVVADVNFGYDHFTTESWAEVQAIYWQKKNGKPGKEIPTHIRDRAEAYDYGFCSLIEQVNEYLAHERESCS